MLKFYSLAKQKQLSSDVNLKLGFQILSSLNLFQNLSIQGHTLLSLSSL